MSTITVANKAIGAGQPAYLIAEIAQAHDGSLDLAHDYIDAAAQAGCDAVKFQTHIAAAESTLDEPFRVTFSDDATRYDYWKRMEFSAEEWLALKEHAHEKGLAFISSPFSVEAVNLLESLPLDAYKIASGEYASPDLLQAITETGRPVLISSGMSTLDEIDTTLTYFQQQKTSCAILQCTSEYPTPLEHVGLNVMDTLRDRYALPTGLSDHTGNLHSTMAAIARGAQIIEAHIALSPDSPGPDTPVSLLPEEWAALCAFRDDMHTMLSNPVDKDALARELAPLKGLFSKSLALTQDRPKGHVLTAEDITEKKPGTGIAPGEKQNLLGKALAYDVQANRLLTPEDIDGYEA